MAAPRQHLENLSALLRRFDNESGDVVIGRMIPEFAALIVQLSADLDAAQRKVVRLTWALFWLTVVLLVIAIAQLVVSMKPPQAAAPATTQQETKGVPSSPTK